MKLLFKYRSPKEHYHADACVVWCIDLRFAELLEKFLKKVGIRKSDVVKIAGGAKDIASPNDPRDRDYALRQIRTSVRLHGPQEIVVMSHQDCGGYGGSIAFANDAEFERHTHEDELQKAVSLLRNEFPHLKVRGAFADFDGVWEV